MKIAPLDLRRARFGSAVRGFNRAEVSGFLNEAADGYEQAIRDTDRLQQEVGTLQQQLEEHRQREATLRDTLLTAQRVSAEVRQSAKQEAQLIVREARGRASDVVREARARCEDAQREVTQLQRKRADVEGSLEGSIAALRHALDFVKQQDRDRHATDRDRPQTDKVRPHHPKTSDGRGAAVQRSPHPVITAVES